MLKQCSASCKSIEDEIAMVTKSLQKKEEELSEVQAQTEVVRTENKEMQVLLDEAQNLVATGSLLFFNGTLHNFTLWTLQLLYCCLLQPFHICSNCLQGHLSSSCINLWHLRHKPHLDFIWPLQRLCCLLQPVSSSTSTKEPPVFSSPQLILFRLEELDLFRNEEG